jgi:2'-5' RNA ligase
LRALARTVAAQRGGRAPRDENLHVTVAFLGSVATGRVNEVASIGEASARSSSPFVLTLDRIGGTAHGIAWLAPADVPASLDRLQRTVSGHLDAAGFAIERRRFRPHVTLARHCTLAPHRNEVTPVAWRVDRLALVASTTATGGSRYTEIAAWPLIA